MRLARFPIDWKMVLGFGGLLLLTMAIGLVGIQQIKDLSAIITHLARIDIPVQNAVVQMKSANNQYANGIRSYIFWKGAKYLDAAPSVDKLSLMRTASANFDAYSALYGSLATTDDQRVWLRTLRANQAQLREIGDEIVRLVDDSEKLAVEERATIEANLSRKLMDFESKLYQIDAFCDDPIQKKNLVLIDEQLARAEAGRDRSLLLLFWSLLVGLGLGAQTAYLTYRRSKRDSEHRELLARTVIKVEEEEKNHLSMQVHDQMGQDLSALKIYLGLVDRDLPVEAGEQKDKIDKAKKIIDGLMQKTHNISEMLRPPELDDVGLAESIGASVVQLKELIGCHIHFDMPEPNLKLSNEYSLLMYRVAQEALTNVAKYSNAKNVTITLLRRPNSVFLCIADDGQGFDYQAYKQQPQRRSADKRKLGLQGLRERIELFGGRLRIDSKIGAGTRLEVELPAV